jgi:hypothetical protein
MWGGNIPAREKRLANIQAFRRKCCSLERWKTSLEKLKTLKGTMIISTAGEVVKGQIMRGLVKQDKNIVLHSKNNMRPLRDLFLPFTKIALVYCRLG